METHERRCPLAEDAEKASCTGRDAPGPRENCRIGRDEMCKDGTDPESQNYVYVGAYPGWKPRDAPTKSKNEDRNEAKTERYPTREHETRKAATDQELTRRIIEAKALSEAERMSADGPPFAGSHCEVETDDESLYSGDK